VRETGREDIGKKGKKGKKGKQERNNLGNSRVTHKVQLAPKSNHFFHFLRVCCVLPIVKTNGLV
jgi:hypothetical protein